MAREFFLYRLQLDGQPRWETWDDGRYWSFDSFIFFDSGRFLVFLWFDWSRDSRVREARRKLAESAFFDKKRGGVIDGGITFRFFVRRRVMRPRPWDNRETARVQFDNFGSFIRMVGTHRFISRLALNKRELVSYIYRRFIAFQLT